MNSDEQNSKINMTLKTVDFMEIFNSDLESPTEESLDSAS